jgi:uncharacterized protein with HEPN domain
MSKLSLEFLRHIVIEADFIQTRLSRVAKAPFMRDETLKRAVVRSIEIIGEASKNVDVGLKAAHPEIEWKSVAGMRDRLIHAYFGIDYDIVWDVAKNKVPDLHAKIRRMLVDLEDF